MTAGAHASPLRAGATRWRILAAVLTLISLVALIGGVRGWLEGPDPREVAGPSRSQLEPVRAVPPLVRDVRPVELTIADIGVSTPLISLGLNKDETVEVPADADVAGWYRLGPAPGEAGSAVVLGHVDSVAGPAVFHRLRTLASGARVSVVRADGSTVRFQVRAVATYLNKEFPAAAVYRNRGRPTLTLVTCGGAYDASRGGYQANVVVVADLL